MQNINNTTLDNIIMQINQLKLVYAIQQEFIRVENSLLNKIVE